MILSGKEIKKQINKNIIINPFNEKQLNPNSYDLRLYNKLSIYEDDYLDIKKNHKTKEIIIPEEGYIIKPNKLYLGRTLEYTETKKFVPLLEGKSSTGRLGIYIHICAAFGDVGFKGYWTLEISCVQPVRIYPFIKICQIYYHTIYGKYEEYKGKYQNNKDIQPSFMYKEFDKK